MIREGGGGAGEHPLDEEISEVARSIQKAPASPNFGVSFPTFFVDGPNNRLKFVDARNVSKEDRNRAFHLLRREIQRLYAPEIRCNERSLEAHDARQLQKEFGIEVARSFLKDQISQRSSFDFTEGDIHPITLAIYDGATKQIVGALQWAGIRRLGVSKDGSFIRLSASPIPAYAWMESLSERHEFTLDLIERLFDHVFEIRGTNYRVTQVRAPLFVHPNRDNSHLWQRTILTWIQASRARRDKGTISIQTIQDPNTEDRVVQVIRRG